MTRGGASRAAESLGLTRGRAIVGAVVAAYFVLLAGLGGHSEWDRLGVPPLAPVFADLRSITSGWECVREGIEVLERNPCDPLGARPSNYPRLWMWPAGLGLGQESTVTLGLLLACIFFLAALAVLPRDAGPGRALAFSLAVCSPAVMLGVERGNVDLALFALVVPAVLLLRGRPAARVAGHAAVLLAGMLKLFPIFAALVLARRPSRRAAAGLGAVVGLFLVYAAATADDIRVIARVVPQTDYLSYGMRRFTEPAVDRIEAVWPGLADAVHERLTMLGLDLALATLVVAAAVLARPVVAALVPSPDPGPEGRRDLDLFWAGAAVYVGSYAVFRSWDYRLAFTLLTIPLLLRWLRQDRRLALPVLVTLGVVLWLDAQPYWLPLVGADEVFIRTTTVAQLLLFALYAAVLVGTAPGLPARLREGRSAA